jgi:hypothetical protein
MEMQHKKLQTYEKELFLQTRVVAECHTTNENILNKKIREYVIVHMRVADLAYKRCLQKKNLLSPTPCFLLEG